MDRLPRAPYDGAPRSLSCSIRPTVVVVNSSQLICDLLAAAIAQDENLQVVGATTDAIAAAKAYALTAPDSLVVYANSPLEITHDAIRLLAGALPKTRILVVHVAAVVSVVGSCSLL